MIASQVEKLKGEHNGEGGPGGLLPPISCLEAKETMALYADGYSRWVPIRDNWKR